MVFVSVLDSCVGVSGTKLSLKNKIMNMMSSRHDWRPVFPGV